MITKQKLHHEADSKPAPRSPQTKDRYQTIQPTVLFVTSLQLSVSGNDFTVHGSNGDLFMRTEGKAFDLKSRIDFSDSDGEILLHLRKEMLGPKARWIGENPSGIILFQIERQLSCASDILTGWLLLRPAYRTLVSQGPGRLTSALSIRRASPRQSGI